jgi:protein-tyrosine phosphatase
MTENIKQILQSESGTVEIAKRIYIAPISIIYKPDSIKYVDVIVNCTKETYEYDTTKNYYQVPVDDTARQENIDNFVIYSKEILQDVIEDYKKGKIILVHCSQGVQRSAAFIAFILVKIFDISLERAVNRILLKKPNCFFHGRQINFKESLDKLLN